MGMSEKDLEILLQKNPSLKVRTTTKNSAVPRPVKDNQVDNLLNEQASKKRKNKYCNKKLYEYESGMTSENKNETDFGRVLYVFDSTKEYNRWIELKYLQESGEICNLRRQVRLLIQDGFTYMGKRIRKIEYVADFTYEKGGQRIVEDVKPYDERKGCYRLTKDFALKWKLLKYKYPDQLFVVY